MGSQAPSSLSSLGNVRDRSSEDDHLYDRMLKQGDAGLRAPGCVSEVRDVVGGAMVGPSVRDVLPELSWEGEDTKHDIHRDEILGDDGEDDEKTDPGFRIDLLDEETFDGLPPVEVDSRGLTTNVDQLVQGALMGGSNDDGFQHIDLNRPDLLDDGSDENGPPTIPRGGF